MKTIHYFLLLPIALFSSYSEARAVASMAQVQNEGTFKSPLKCTSNPCGNTASGEDPADERLSRGQNYLNAIVAGPSDEKRWTIPIFSDSKDPKELETYLIKRNDFRLRLTPKTGHIQFIKGAAIDVFKIGLPQDSSNTTCKDYTINVVNASGTHALIQKSCYEIEYRPGRFRSEITYFLYDRVTHSMRTLWESYTSVKDAPSPAPNTKPSLFTSPDGYEIRWDGNYIFEGKQKKLSLHNRYTWESRSDGTKSLICRDLLHSGNAEPETGACEGGYLPLVSSTASLKKGQL